MKTEGSFHLIQPKMRYFAYVNDRGDYSGQMTTIKDFINSGIIEVYCMGAATDEEQLQVEQMAQQYPEVHDEIKAVRQALESYALGSSPVPFAEIKNKIMEVISGEENNNLSFPPRITMQTTIDEWQQYITHNKIASPVDYDLFYLLNLPGNEQQYSYMAWARKGAVLEETHAEEDEYLFMMEGYCSVTIDGVLGYYKAGDVVFIPKGALHRAEALSTEPMLLIGQRLAA